MTCRVTGELGGTFITKPTVGITSATPYSSSFVRFPFKLFLSLTPSPYFAVYSSIRSSPREIRCPPFTLPSLRYLALGLKTYRHAPANKRELCHLTCKQRSTGRNEKLSARVVDGTKCTRNSQNICVAGICMVGSRNIEILLHGHII